jgi:hypothetical protein
VAKQVSAYWMHHFLHVAGLPVTDGTVLFMADWRADDNAPNCDYNPIDLSQGEPGSTRCTLLPNGKRARNYTDPASAAQAFADQLNLSDYPHLRKAIASGDPYGYNDVPGVALDLQKWGSTVFQTIYVKQTGATPTGSGGQPVRHSKQVGQAWAHLMRTLAVDGHRTIVELQKATASLSRIERRLRRA